MLNNHTGWVTDTDDFFRESLLANQVRGTDSTGLFQVDRQGVISWHKMGVNASEYLKNGISQTAINRVPNCPITVGHVRARTVGDISAENAHPFHIVREDGTKLIGVHNGTLQGWKNKPGSDKYNVDSHWLMHMLATEGHDAFEYFSGAFAIVWYDSAHPNSVFMARNNDRPLCYMVDESKKTLLGCSELGMLGWLSSRNGFKCAKEGNLNTPFYLTAGKIYEFDLKNLGNFKEVEYPKYDPSTSVIVAGASSVYTPAANNTALVPLGPRGSYSTRDIYDTEDEEYGGDDIPWTHHPYYNVYNQQGRLDYLEENQEFILDKVKKELHEVRWNRAKIVDVEPVVVDEDALDRAMHRALEEQSSRPEPIPRKLSLEQAISRGEITLPTVKASTAGQDEISAAKELGLYGRVVEFKGIEYDDQIDTCIGVFTITEQDYDPYECEGEIRFLPHKVARDVFIERRSGMAIITGYRSTDNWYVLQMPTTEERLFISNRTFELDDKRVMN